MCWERKIYAARQGRRGFDRPPFWGVRQRCVDGGVALWPRRVDVRLRADGVSDPSLVVRLLHCANTRGSLVRTTGGGWLLALCAPVSVFGPPLCGVRRRQPATPPLGPSFELNPRHHRACAGWRAVLVRSCACGSPGCVWPPVSVIPVMRVWPSLWLGGTERTQPHARASTREPSVAQTSQMHREVPLRCGVWRVCAGAVAWVVVGAPIAPILPSRCAVGVGVLRRCGVGVATAAAGAVAQNTLSCAIA